jgi:hypothetical protein
MVYQFALREITDPIMFPSSGEVRKPQPNRGALALIHTSKFIRDDSYGTMWYQAHRCANTLRGIYMTASARTREVRKLDNLRSPEYKQAQDSSHRACRQTIYISVIISALSKAMAASWHDYNQELFQEDIATNDLVVHHKANG